MRRLALVLIFLSSLRTHAGDCESRLLIGNILGVVRASLSNGAMDLAALKTFAASESPESPLDKITPTSMTSAPRRALKALLSDPLAHAMWAETRKQLQVLIASLDKDEQIRAENKHATRTIINPHPLGPEIETSGHSMSLVVLADGTALAAHFRDDQVAVVRVNDGQELHHWHATPHKTEAQRRLAWHRDANGKLWLYTASSKDGNFYFQRIDPENPTRFPIQITNSLKGGSVGSLESLSDGSIVAEVRHADLGAQFQYFNLAGSEVQRVKAPPGGVGTGINQLDYTDKSGRRFSISKDPLGLLHVYDWHADAGYSLDLPKKSFLNQKIEVAENSAGEVLLSVRQQEGPDGRYVFFNLSSGDPRPIYVREANHIWSYSTKWFRGPAGQMLFAFITSEGESFQFHIVDPQACSAVVSSYNFPFSAHEWHTFGDRTFASLLVTDKDRLKIIVIDLFGEAVDP